jgi:hypothetical protein
LDPESARHETGLEEGASIEHRLVCPIFVNE